MHMPPKIVKTIACSCVSQRVSQTALPMMFFARSATLGKQRRRIGRGSCGETHQAQESAEAKVASASGMRNLQVAVPSCQKPQCAPSICPTERCQPTPSTSLSQTSQHFSCLGDWSTDPSCCAAPSRALPCEKRWSAAKAPRIRALLTRRQVHVDHISLVCGDETIFVAGTPNFLELRTNPRSELDFETAVLQLCDDALFRPV